MGSDLLFLWKKLKTGNEKTGRTDDHGNPPGSFMQTRRLKSPSLLHAELIQMHWSIGAYLSELCAASSFCDKIVDEVAAYIAQENPCVKGFNCRGLYRMKQFYETYKDDGFVTPLATQISWTNHLLIMSGSKTVEERRFTWRSAQRSIIPQMCLAYIPRKKC